MKNKDIWAIAGGKGGVGKSFLSSNLSIDLAQKGKKVVLIDADFGAANLHNFLGVPASPISISDFLASDHLKLEDVLLNTGIENLRLASGAHDTLKMSDIRVGEKNKLVDGIKELDADYVVVDLGAGIGFHTLDLFLAADRGILITAPEPTSIENTYRFIKSAFYRKLLAVVKHQGLREFIKKLNEKDKKKGLQTVADLIAEISESNYRKGGDNLKYELARINLKLILNQVRTSTDKRIGFSMGKACKKYFGVNLGYAGFVEHDKYVLQSIRQRRPVMLQSPSSRATSRIARIGQNIRRNYHLVPAF